MTTNSIKYMVMIILIATLVIPLNIITSNGESSLNLSIRSSGDFLSYNSTGSEDSKSLNMKSSLVKIGDGELSDVWDTVINYPVSAFGEKGKIASIYGDDTVYFLIKHDVTDFVWVAMQWDTELTVEPGADMGGMHSGDDMWIFGSTEQISVLGDGISDGTEGDLARQDLVDDLSWERILVNDTDGAPDYIAWEIQRAKDTGDIQGKDVVFSVGENVHVMLASNVFHKQNDPVVMAFILSNKVIGGSGITNIIIPVEEDLDANGIFLKYISIGLLIGTFTYMFVYFPTMYIINKEKEEEMGK